MLSCGSMACDCCMDTWSALSNKRFINPLEKALSVLSNLAAFMQVKAAIKRGSKVKRTIAAFFFDLSGAFIRARRVKNGVDLKWATQARPWTALLAAFVTVAFLAPFHRQMSYLTE